MVNIENKEAGFSLVEVLIVIAIFSVIALVVSQTLFSTLKGAARSEVSSSIKQEGNYVISVMERQLHNSIQITSCGPTSIVYRDAYSQSVSFSCDGGRVASNSASITSPTTTVTGCSIICSPITPPYRSVDVNMTFERIDSTGTLRPEEKARVDLRTKIQLRN
jgi:prepilin-type N-terminal cleavage/methylation domain-containing protein